MKHSKLFLVLGFVFLVLLGGSIVCKHVVKKAEKIEKTEVGKVSEVGEVPAEVEKYDRYKKPKKMKKVKTWYPQRSEEEISHATDGYFLRPLGFRGINSPAGKTIKNAKGEDVQDDKLYVRVECIENYKWVIASRVFNGRPTLDVEQMKGNNNWPVRCKK